MVQAVEAAAKAREQGISAPVVNTGEVVAVRYFHDLSHLTDISLGVDAAASMSPLSAQNRIASTTQSPANWQNTHGGSVVARENFEARYPQAQPHLQR